MLKKIFKILLVLSGLAIACIVVYLAMIASAFGAFDKDYSVSELVEHYNDKEKEITELKEYFKKIVPSKYFVEIEFDSNKELGRFGITEMDTNEKPIYPIYLDWHVKIKTSETDSIIAQIGWTRATLKELKEKLDNAGCIEIANYNPTQIGFQRSGMGMYFYRVFDENVTDKQREEYNDSCTFILINNHMALEYGGGAIGTQCFYNLE